MTSWYRPGLLRTVPPPTQLLAANCSSSPRPSDHRSFSGGMNLCHRTTADGRFHVRGSPGAQQRSIQTSCVLRKPRAAPLMCMERNRGLQPHTPHSYTATHRAHLSKWVKGSLSKMLGPRGPGVTDAPKHREDDSCPVAATHDKKEDTSLKEADVNVSKADQTQQDHLPDVLPASEDFPRKQSSEVMNIQTAAKAKENHDPHSLEQCVEQTNESIKSYHQYQQLVSPKDTSETRKLHQTSPTDDDSSWSVLDKIPFFNTSSAKKKPLSHKQVLTRAAVDARTRALVDNIRGARSTASKINRTKELSAHLKRFPGGRHEATEHKAVPLLLRLKQAEDQEVREEAREALTLLGYVEPVKGRGVRILTIDGGGTRGLVAIKCLQQLEKLSGRRTYELFDYVSGVSTGALIATMVCLYRMPLRDCEQLYKDLSRQMFSRSRVLGTGGLMWNHAFYSSEQWEQILRTGLGDKTMIEYSRDPRVPKMSAVSTLMNTPSMRNFVFRNYNLPPSTHSHYPGSCNHQMWQVVRASSAAPGYYENFTLGEYVHSDGGMSSNNPAALAVHESHLLWPHETIQCVISLGTGRYEPTSELDSSRQISLKDKVNRVLDSATDTEAVHVMMTDLMPPGTYFRFNPYLTENLPLDEIRTEQLDKMLQDTKMYLRKNEVKMQKAVTTVTQGRLLHQKMLDYVKLRADTLF